MENRDNVIEVRNISKKFKIYKDKSRTIQERFMYRERRKYEERNVINGISFDVKKGEALGLIGHNGCGKSTLLKLLTKIMYPENGSIEISGRVSSLLELGAGFHPDLSGKENIYINASIFGLTRKEIDKRINTIIAFSELEEFIDNPVRTYSSGMYMRLAFSVAINVNAEILLIDEILAVGDINFQSKCFNKLMEIKKKGTTIILVSHSTDQIEQVCDRSIWIHEGKILAEGFPREVNKEYLSFMSQQRNDNIRIEVESIEKANIENEELKKEDEKNTHHRGTGEIKIINVEALDKNGIERKIFNTGDTITFRIYYKVFQRIEEALFGLSIFRIDGERVYGSNTQSEGIKLIQLDQDGYMDVTFEQLGLLKGKYYLDVCIGRSFFDMVDYFDTTCEFEEIDYLSEMGITRLQHEWRMKCNEF